MRFLKKICNRIFPKSIPTPIIVENITLSPSLLLNNRKVLITGGTSGIGFAIAKACINAGAAVVITGRNKERVNKLENKDYQVYFTGAKYRYQNEEREVETNEYLIAIKNA